MDKAHLTYAFEAEGMGVAADGRSAIGEVQEARKPVIGGHR